MIYQNDFDYFTRDDLLDFKVKQVYNFKMIAHSRTKKPFHCTITKNT